MALISADDTGGCECRRYELKCSGHRVERRPFVRHFSVANNFACVGATGAFDWVHSELARSVRILGSDHVLSTSDDGTIAISVLLSNEVVSRVEHGVYGPRISTVLPDGSIAARETAGEFLTGLRRTTGAFL